MIITLNGEKHTHSGDGSLPALLAEIKADNNKAAVMINNKIIAKEDLSSTMLTQGDTVEILIFAGGG